MKQKMKQKMVLQFNKAKQGFAWGLPETETGWQTIFEDITHNESNFLCRFITNKMVICNKKIIDLNFIDSILNEWIQINVTLKMCNLETVNID